MAYKSKCEKHKNNIYISFGAQKRVNSAVYKVKRVEVETQHNGRFKYKLNKDAKLITMIEITNCKVERKNIKYLLTPQRKQGKEPLTSEARKKPEQIPTEKPIR